MDEIWKDVVGLEKWFEVSNKGSKAMRIFIEWDLLMLQG